MLNSKQKRQLKGLAMQESALYQIGKNEIGESMLDMLDKALTARELIKISVLKSQTVSIRELALDLSSALHADVVQMIGRVIVLYRKNEKEPKIKLVK
ncbi:MAG: YhbY family RNA-binding protein [Erysipelotrichales bacterium]|nr:YhbY family RNA-binding protein [Erysipelotrichales bacterium]